MDQVWLAVYYVEGEDVGHVYGIYNSEDKARQGFGGNIGGKPTEWKALVDHPSLRLAHWAIYLDAPRHLQARENWLARYGECLKAAPESTTAEVLIFEQEPLTDPLVSRLGDGTSQIPCPLPPDVDWPVCMCCDRDLVVYAVIDYRGSLLADQVGGQALVILVCDDLHHEDIEFYWVNAAHMKLHGDPSKPVSVGKRYMVQDYPIEDEEYVQAFSVQNPDFVHERQWYRNLVSNGSKIGGLPNWIQSPVTPYSKGKPMTFIGQFNGPEEISGMDQGSLYVFYCEDSQETDVFFQFY